MSARMGVLLAVALAGCLRPGEERAGAELDVGRGAGDGVALAVDDGMAHVRELDRGGATLWAQAPVLGLTLEVDAAGPFRLVVDNALPDAEIAGAQATTGARPTQRVFELDLPAGESRVVLAPPEAARAERFAFAAMADIQTGMGAVGDVFAAIAAEPAARFVIAMGDLAEDSRPEEYAAFEAALAGLPIPFYTTVGNHDVLIDSSPFRARFGRTNVHFVYREVAFTLLDSGNAGIDPIVYDWLDRWLADGRDRLHVVGTHFPPIDPIGVRSGGFRNRAEAHKLLGRLAEARVDLTLYGHIHSYLQFENAGIPAFISGGGGARPERWDGIGRHFLLVEAVPEEGRIGGVALVRVD